MAGASGWLIALSFALGMALTLAFTIRRVTGAELADAEADGAAAVKPAGDEPPAPEPGG